MSYWHLAAACCFPNLNPERRIREQEIFAEARDAAQRRDDVIPPRRGRWEARPLTAGATKK
jgi:hypothetical protein